MNGTARQTSADKVRRVAAASAAFLLLGGVFAGLIACKGTEACEELREKHATESPPGPVATSPPSTGARLVELRAGDSYTIALDSDPSNGYQWHIEWAASFVELIEHRYEPHSPQEGAEGQEIFVLRALDRGRAEILFEYA